MAAIKELDPSLLSRANCILETKSARIGKDYWDGKVKKALDRLVLLSSPIVLPTIALCGFAIYLDDGHWPFVDLGQQSLNTGKHVPFWKLRTMIPNAHAKEFEVIKGRPLSEVKSNMIDPRITSIGSKFRTTSLDETPQLVNCMLGHMSLVGPRMPAYSDWKNIINPNQEIFPYKEFIELLKNGIRYGVTGFYGIFGRASLHHDDRYRLEVLYGERASFKADLRIVVATIPALFSGR